MAYSLLGIVSWRIIDFKITELEYIVKKVLWQLGVFETKFHTRAIVLGACFCADKRNVIELLGL